MKVVIMQTNKTGLSLSSLQSKTFPWGNKLKAGPAETSRACAVAPGTLRRKSGWKSLYPQTPAVPSP